MGRLADESIVPQNHRILLRLGGYGGFVVLGFWRSLIVNRVVSATIAASAVFLGLIALYPSANQQRFLILNPDGSLGVSAALKPSDRGKAQSEAVLQVSTSEALLNWRLQYSRHYMTMDRLREEKMNIAPDGALETSSGRSAGFDVAPAGFQEVSVSQDTATRSTQALLRDQENYWKQLSTQTEEQLVRLTETKAALLAKSNRLSNQSGPKDRFSLP